MYKFLHLVLKKYFVFGGDIYTKLSLSGRYLEYFAVCLALAVWLVQSLSKHAVMPT